MLLRKRNVVGLLSGFELTQEEFDGDSKVDLIAEYTLTENWATPALRNFSPPVLYACYFPTPAAPWYFNCASIAGDVSGLESSMSKVGDIERLRVFLVVLTPLCRRFSMV